MEMNFIPLPKVRPVNFYGSGNCRDDKHYTNLLLDGNCQSCERAFSLGEDTIRRKVEGTV